jgi:hypothetical protein
MEKKNRTDRTHRTDRTWRRRSVMALMVIVLGAAGVGRGGLAPARKLLPEATVLDRLDGTVLHVDANDTWLFELERDVNDVDVRIPAGTRFVLLPSATLGKLITDMNDRAAPQYRLTVRVTQYQGRNYLIPTYFLPLSKLKSDQGPEDGGQKTEDGGRRTEDGRRQTEGGGANPQSATANPPSGVPEPTIPPEIMKQLQERRPLRTAPSARPDQEPAQGAQNEPAPAERMLVNRVGLIQKEDGHFVFIPYALGWNLSDVRYELLPSRVLEQALRQQTGTLERMRFNVAGLVTEFHGRKYLLLQRAVPVYNYGDFGR